MTIEVRGDDGAYIQRQAIAYVGGSGEDAFTLPFTTPPSEAYLVAIRSHLRDHWDDVDQIDVRCAARGAVAQWSYPYQDPTRLDLASLCVEVNARRTAPWTMPAAIRPRCTALVEAGLTTTAEVAAALCDRRSAFSAVDWDEDGLRALAQVPLHRVFVYGSLLTGLHNSGRLAGARLLGTATTSDEFCSGRRGPTPTPSTARTRRASPPRPSPASSTSARRTSSTASTPSRTTRPIIKGGWCGSGATTPRPGCMCCATPARSPTSGRGPTPSPTRRATGARFWERTNWTCVIYRRVSATLSRYSSRALSSRRIDVRTTSPRMARSRSADKAPLSDMDASAAARKRSDSMKLRNRESLSHVSSRNSRNTVAATDASATGSDFSKRAARAAKLGVPTNRSMSRRPGRTTAESKAANRLVATRKMAPLRPSQVVQPRQHRRR